MQIDWTTFVLEILNFLVLVWILQHFLYRPVLNVLDARKARLATESTQAAQKMAEAEALRRQYETRLADWQGEREQLQHKLNEELQQARVAGMESLKKKLADEEAKARARTEAMAASREAAAIHAASGQAFGAAAAMLQRMASPQLTQAIVQLLLEDLAALPEDERASLRKAAVSTLPDTGFEVASAHPLESEALEKLRAVLEKASGKQLEIHYQTLPELIAGVRIGVGECLLHANLADELAFFQQDRHA